jgi:hypothetical protein
MASSSSDEGEIRDSEKANKSPFVKDPSVDRQDRKRSRYSRSPSLSNDDGYTISAARSRTEVAPHTAAILLEVLRDTEMMTITTVTTIRDVPSFAMTTILPIAEIRHA